MGVGGSWGEAIWVWSGRVDGGVFLRDGMVLFVCLFVGLFFYSFVSLFVFLFVGRLYLWLGRSHSWVEIIF